MPSIRVQKKRRRLRREYMTWLESCASALGVKVQPREFIRSRYSRIRNVAMGLEKPDKPIAYWYVDGTLTRFVPPRQERFEMPNVKRASVQDLLENRFEKMLPPIVYRGIPFGMGNNNGVRVQVLLYIPESEPTGDQRREIKDKVWDLYATAFEIVERQRWNTTRVSRIRPF